MKDATYNLVKALPNAAANNNTTSIDLGLDPGSNVWQRARIQVDFPALSDHTNTSVTNLITLQTSTDNSTWANTVPLIQLGVVGVASTGSAAVSVQFPLPPNMSRYARFNQNVPANGGIGGNANVNYDVLS